MAKEVVLNTIFRLKRGTAARWAELNPVLQQGEPGFAYDEGILKIGNGTSTWNELVEISGASSGVYNASTYFDFPSVGNIETIYKAQSEKKLYQWNPDLMTYELLGSSTTGGIDISEIAGHGLKYDSDTGTLMVVEEEIFKNITEINGGDANGST